MYLRDKKILDPENKPNSCFNCTDVNCFVKVCMPNWIRNISERKTEKKIKKGDSIFKTGNFVQGLFFVKKGKVKVASVGLKNKEQIVRLAANGHILGHRGFGGKFKEKYPVSAIALDDSVVCFIDNDTVFEAFYFNPQFVIEIMMFYSKELRAIEARMKYMVQMNAHEKVAFALLYLKEIFGCDADSNLLNINISIEDISALSGVDEDLIKQKLQQFDKEGFISKKDNGIQFTNETELQRMVDAYQ